MTETDAFCFDQKGSGEFGNGEFYEPTKDFSFKTFSAFRGILALLHRWNIPLTLTADYMFETNGSEESKKMIRSLVPEADSVSVGFMVWSEVWEKDCT